MTEAAVPSGYWQDSQGRLVPESLVKAEHQLEDRLVRELVAGAEELAAKIREYREKSLRDIAAFLDLLADQYKAERGGNRGNVTLNSFDGLLRIQLAIGDQLAFGPELQTAKSIVDDCLRAWSKGADAKLQAIVADAFNVDKKGKLNVDRILALRRLDIDDPTWQRAMQAISDAIRVERSKTYLRLYRRRRREDKLDQISLDIASA